MRSFSFVSSFLYFLDQMNARMMIHSCTTLRQLCWKHWNPFRLESLTSIHLDIFCFRCIFVLVIHMLLWWYIHAPRLGNYAENIEILSDWSLWKAFEIKYFLLFHSFVWIFLYRKWVREWWYIHAPRLGNCAENIEILSDWSLWLVLVCDVFKAFLFVSFSSSFWRKVCDYDELSCTTLSLRKRGCAETAYLSDWSLWNHTFFPFF